MTKLVATTTNQAEILERLGVIRDQAICWAVTHPTYIDTQVDERHLKAAKAAIVELRRKVENDTALPVTLYSRQGEELKPERNVTIAVNGKTVEILEAIAKSPRVTGRQLEIAIEDVVTTHLRVAAEIANRDSDVTHITGKPRQFEAGNIRLANFASGSLDIDTRRLGLGSASGTQIA